MNLLTGVSTQNTLVKSLPLQAPRSSTIRKLMLANTALYGLYVVGSGPFKLRYEHLFTATPESRIESLAYFHFAHTSLPQFLFNQGIFYTLGNYHVAAYGCASFLSLFGAAALGGSVLTAAGLFSGKTQHQQAGAMAPAAGLVTYHAFKNPGWFRFLLRPIPALALLTLYGAYYGDRAAIGGVSFGYLAFLLGL